jgi:UDPglucose 6-dehydrogenase
MQEGKNMNVQIIGYGTVGKAQEFLMRRLGHNVTVYDPYVLPESQLSQNVDITFICTPEDAVDGAIERLMKSKVQGLYVIKSTVPVGTTEGLMEKHRIHICHNPEFLREKYAFEDVLNPDRIVIGRCCTKHGELLANLYAPLGKPIYITVPKISELAKLVSNAHLSMLITFWNEVAQLADKLNISTSELAEIVTADHRISKYGTSKFGEPFGGKCLPKDLEHLIRCYHTLGLNPIIFEAIKKYNEKLGGSNK